ncbi:hypothetical protein [uncultured Bacteroides sp.]|uniref:hypothetical protein n=1 Tax=uncultured Bacteroides sp. TaxID=162156 RepID=UPI002AAC4661|nr:hypothetical protein [uncultured Bacteroides sp.]
MGIQNRNNAMYFASGIDNSGLREDAEEGKKIIKDMTGAVVSEGKKMSEAFKPTTAVQAAQQIKSKIDELKTGIKQTEIDIKSLQATFDKAAPGRSKMFALQELNAAKKALNEDKVALQELDAQHQNTSTTAQRLTYQVRQLKDEMGKMALAGGRDSQAYADLQTKAALLQRQLTGANKAMKVLASPTANFQGVISGVTGFTGAVTAGMGVMGLFADENANLAKIQTRLQAVMAITIGLQQVATTLNKNSAFQLVFVAKAQDFLTASTARLATALGISNAAAKGLMATLTLGLSLVITGLIYAWDKYTTSQNQAKEASKQSAKEMEQAISSASTTMGEQMVTLYKLMERWDSLGGNLKKQKKFVVESKDEFHKLGISVDNVTQAENALVNNTGSVVKALQLRAQAAAYSKIAQDEYEKMARGEITAQHIEASAPIEEDFPMKSMATGTMTTSPDGRQFETHQMQRDMKDVKAAEANRKKRADKIRIGAKVHLVWGNKQMNSASDLEKEVNKELGSANITPWNGEDGSKAEAAAAKRAAAEAKRKAEEEAKFNNKTNEIDEKQSTEKTRMQEDSDMKTLEARISSLKDGSDKTILQMKLNHQKELLELKREREDKLKTRVDEERQKFEANPANKAKVFDSSTVTLTKAEEDEYNKRLKAMLESQGKDYSDYYTTILNKYKTYEQARKKIHEDAEKDRKSLQQAGATKEQYNELDKNTKDALEAVDKQFGEREDSFKLWMNSIANMSIKQLRTTLKEAEQALLLYQMSHTANADGSFKEGDNNVAVLRARIQELQKKLIEIDKKNYNGKDAIENWKNLSEVLKNVNKDFEEIGNSIGGTTGEILKGASDIGTSALGMISNITTLANWSVEATKLASQGASEAIIAVEKASIILAVISAAMQIVEKIKSILSTTASDQYELDFQKEKIELQQKYNLALVEQLAIQKEMFSSNLSNALSYVKAYYAALENYQSLYDDAVFTRIKKKRTLGDVWGSVATLGAYRDKSGSDTYTVDARENMQIQTSKGNFWHHSKYANLETWLKDNKYGDLFKSDGSLNLNLAKSVAEMSALTDETKNYLSQLIDAQEEVDKMNDSIDSYINDEFGSLSNDLMTSLVDSIANGTDAWTAFGEAGSTVLENLGKELAYTLYFQDYFNAFKTKMQALLKSGASETDIVTQQRAIMAELFSSIKSNMSSSTDFLKEWASTSKELNDNWDLYSSDTATSASKVEAAITENTASEVLGAINMGTLDIRTIKEMLPSHFDNYATTMNNVSAILDQTRQISANTLRTADNTDGLKDGLSNINDGIKSMDKKLTDITKNTKDNSGR